MAQIEKPRARKTGWKDITSLDGDSPCKGFHVGQYVSEETACTKAEP
jgi:hypothetical protein